MAAAAGGKDTCLRPGGGLTMKPGLKMHQGHVAGRDPREMTQDELREAGHEPMSPLQALRAHCLDCVAYQEKEVALCPAVRCPSWPFRMGANPWRKPASQARRQAARRTMAGLNARRRERGGAEMTASPSEHETAPLSAIGSGAAPIWAAELVGRSSNAARYRARGDGPEEVGVQSGGERTPGDGAVAAAAHKTEGGAA